MSGPRTKEIPNIPIDMPPEWRAVLVAMKEKLEALEGRGDVDDLRPTRRQLVAAGVTNAGSITSD